MCLCLSESSGLSLVEPMFLQLGCTLGCGEGALADASEPEPASAHGRPHKAAASPNSLADLCLCDVCELRIHNLPVHQRKTNTILQDPSVLRTCRS